MCGLAAVLLGWPGTERVPNMLPLRFTQPTNCSFPQFPHFSNINIKLLLFPILTYVTLESYTWRRQWHPTPVLLPGESHEQRSLVGCSPWGREESDTTERLHFPFHFHALEREMAAHSSVLAWRIPGMGEPGGLPSVGLNRVGHD